MNDTHDGATAPLPEFLRTVSTVRPHKALIAGALGIAALLAVGLWLGQGGGAAAPAGTYVTEDAQQGALTVTISASGTLQPTRAVDVGSELSGTLDAVLVDENDRVVKGQMLARLDTARLDDALTKSRAAVAVAEATVAQAEATVAEARATLGRLRRVAEISGGQVPAQTELETAEAALLRAQANEASARAAIVQARAAQTTDETNLRKAAIRSPIDGVVLTRKVEPGQTVVAAMNAPVLFQIAQDLTQMELQVKVDEADVGAVALGQPATFTVSAWSGRIFPATLTRVGIGSTITDNVVTYKTVLRVKNDDLALRPGMTAIARIVTAQREGALLVPNAALRFSPPGETAAGQPTSFVARLLPRPPQPSQPKKAQADRDAPARVWTLVDGRAQPVAVRTGVSDGRHTEVLEGGLAPGMAVVTDWREAAK